MSIKREVLERLLQAIARVWAPWPREFSVSPESIFILRNNDIGDLLVSTPLFEALRKRFPSTRLIVGVANWNLDVLRGNPFLSEVLPVDAPWFNKGRPSHGFAKALRYIFFSPQAKALANLRPAIGIDVVGSQMGALLMVRARIPYRIGSKGYAGGHTAVQTAIGDAQGLHVGRAILRYAEWLGATELPSTRPQIYLTPDELQEGHTCWEGARGRKRVVVAPGSNTAGKTWPPEQFARFCGQLAADSHLVNVIGAPGEEPLGEALCRGRDHVQNLVGQLSLRKAFAVIATADFVVCNSSMAMHAAGAFSKRTVVVLGPDFEEPAHHRQLWAHEHQIVLGRNGSVSLVESEQVIHALAQWG